LIDERRYPIAGTLESGSEARLALKDLPEETADVLDSLVISVG
jgi:hypothetical protein